MTLELPSPSRTVSSTELGLHIPSDVVVERITYREVGGTSLQMLVIRPEKAKIPHWPAIMWFHGGGWKKGRPEQFAPFCIAAVRAGMVAVAPQYRLVGQQAATAWECMDDASAAYRWLVDHAQGLGGDPQRIVAAGSSAGGHLAASIATHHLGAELAALVLLNPVLDCTERGYLMPDRGHEASPIYRVRPGLPPTLIIHGDADTTVPYENSVRFCQAMREAGNACTLVTEPGQEHGLWSRHGQRMMATSYRFLRELGLASR